MALVVFEFEVQIASFAGEGMSAILTQRAYIGNGENSCFILQQTHWAETRDVI